MKSGVGNNERLGITLCAQIIHALGGLLEVAEMADQYLKKLLAPPGLGLNAAVRNFLLQQPSIIMIFEDANLNRKIFRGR